MLDGIEVEFPAVDRGMLIAGVCHFTERGVGCQAIAAEPAPVHQSLTNPKNRVALRVVDSATLSESRRANARRRARCAKKQGSLRRDLGRGRRSRGIGRENPFHHQPIGRI